MIDDREPRRQPVGLLALGGERATPDQLAGYFRSLPPDAFPNLVGLAGELTAGDSDERFEFASELLVRGLEAMADAG